MLAWRASHLALHLASHPIAPCPCPGLCAPHVHPVPGPILRVCGCGGGGGAPVPRGRRAAAHQLFSIGAPRIYT